MPENPKSNQEEIDREENAKLPEQENQNNPSPEQILEMDPLHLAVFLINLQEKGELEKFLENAAENPSLVAQFSYWEKWLEKDQRKLVDKIVAKKREMYGEGENDEDSLPLHLEKRFTRDQLSFMFLHLGAIQLTFGCSRGCPFCGFDAVPGVREHMPYGRLANLFQKYGRELGSSQPLLYWASEPSDYAAKVGAEDKTYEDVHELAVEYAGYSPHITSKEINDKFWLAFLANHNEKGARVSVFGQDPERADQIRETYRGRIEPVGEGTEHIEGIGLSKIDVLEDRFSNKSDRAGIGCIDGLLLTPRGIYGVAQLPISMEFPQGQVVVPFERHSDIEIKPGDSLKDILAEGIIISPHKEWQEKFTLSSKMAGGNIYENPFGEFRKFIKIRTKSGIYRVWYNKDGIVESARKVSVRDRDVEKEIKKLQKRGTDIRDIDPADTWDDAFTLAQKMLEKGKLQGVAFVSPKELDNGNYAPTPLRGTGFSEEESLENLKQTAPMLYGKDNKRFRLMWQKFKVNHPEYPDGNIDALVVVYLKDGEEIYQKEDEN